MVSRSLILASLRDLRGRSWQLALMVLGISLGVAMVVAIDLANTSASRAFKLSTEAVVGRATHRITGGPSGVPVSVYTELKRRQDVGALAPVVETSGLAQDSVDRPVRILGVDPLEEGPFRDFFEAGMIADESLTRFYTQDGMAIVSEQFAAQAGLQPGDGFRVQVNDELAEVEVLGILTTEEGQRNPLPDDVLLMDVAQAQELMGRGDRLTRIDVIADQQQADRIREALPTGVELDSSSEQAETAAQLSRAFQLNLTALSLLALLVGLFLIYNAVMFSVIQRRRVLATLRALGATGRQVFTLILLEAVVIGAIGGAAGVGLGWVLGQGAVHLVSQTIRDFYFVVSVREAPLTATIAFKGLLLGIGSSAVAALAPAREAASVAPVDAMRRSVVESRVRGWLPWVSLAGVGLALVGYAVLSLIEESIAASFVGMFAILVGLALLVPLATVGLMRGASGGLRRSMGWLGQVAARTVVRALSRTSVAIAALMVALSVTIGVGLMIESFRGTVENWLDLTLRADVYVGPPAAGGTRPTGSIDPAWEERMAEIEGVQTVESFHGVTVASEFGPIQLSVVDSSRQRDAGVYRFASGTPSEVWEKVRQGAVIVSEPFAYRYEIPPSGGSVELQTDQGEREFRVIGVFYDYASDQGTVMMSERVYQRYWADRSISSIGLYLEPGAEQAEVVAAVRQRVAGTGLEVNENRSVRQEALRIFDRTFAITASLRLLAVVVAFIGVVSALLALQLERSRELATLRALGLTTEGLWALMFLETGLMGMAAGLMALPTGLILALVLIFVINLRSFGWTMELALSPGIFLQALAIALAAALLAGVYPVWRLGKLRISEALRIE